MVARHVCRPAMHLVLAAAFGAALVCPHAIAHAQRVVSAATPESAPALPRVTLSVDDVPLAAALHAIAEQAGLSPVFNDALIPQNARISLHVRQVSADEAFERALRGTGLVAQMHAKGQVVIVRGSARLQESGVIAGHVVDATTKRPIAGATVTLDDAKNGSLVDDKGAFRLTTAAGEHTIRIRALGYGRQEQRVTVAANQTVTVTVTLSPSENVLSEVVVTGSVVATERKAIPTPITVIKGDELEKRGITRIEQLFRGEVPGVVALERGSNVYNGNGGTNLLGNFQQASVYVRGSSSLNGTSNPLKTYVDGVELFDASYLGTIDPKNIERIEILTGPQAATIYGSGAMGGVMQIFTKHGNGSGRTEFSLNLRYGMLQSNMSDGRAPVHNHALTMQGGSGPEFSYSGTVSHDYSGQWVPGLFSRSTGAQVGATHVRGPVTLNGSVIYTNGRNGTYINSPYASQLVQTGEWRFGAFGYGTQLANREATSSSQTQSLNLDYRATPWWQHHATIGRNQTEFSMVPVAPMYRYPWGDTLYSSKGSTGRRLSMSYNTTLIGTRMLGVMPTLTLGATGTDGQNTSFEGDAATADATSWVNASIYRPLEDKNYGGFGSLQLNVSDKLFLTLGLRGEKNSRYGTGHDIDWTPTNGITYTIEQGDLTLKLLASYGRATRPPSPGQRDQVYNINQYYDPSSYIQYFAAPNLRPEYERGPQGGFELYYGNIGSLTLNRYKETVTDLIMSIVVDSIMGSAFDSPATLYQYQYQNVARIGKQGWEGTGSLRFGALTVKGTYSWNDSRIVSLLNGLRTDGGYSVGQGYYLTPTHSANTTLSYARGGTSLSLVGNWVGSVVMYGSGNAQLLYTVNNARFKTYLPRAITFNAPYTRSGYVKSDLAASQRLTPWASFTLNVNNLGNSFGSESFFFDPATGRQTTFGVSLRSPR